MVGYQSLAFSNGDGNTTLGYQALGLLGSNDFNTSVGYQSLLSLDDGSANLAMGYQSGISYTTTESNNILLNSPGVLLDNNTLRIGAGSGTGTSQLSTAYISGVVNPTLSSGAPTPYLMSQDISSDQLQCLTPVDAATASTTFGSLAVGTALQNTSNYPILVNVLLQVTAATAGQVLVGVGITNTPTARAITPSLTLASVLPYSFSFVVPAKYYARVTTTGTITIGSITTFATQIG